MSGDVPCARVLAAIIEEEAIDLLGDTDRRLKVHSVEQVRLGLVLLRNCSQRSMSNETSEGHKYIHKCPRKSQLLVSITKRTDKKVVVDDVELVEQKLMRRRDQVVL